MVNVISGRGGEAQPANTQQFEELGAVLRSHYQDRVVGLLDEQLEECASGLLLAHTVLGFPPEKFNQASLNFGACAMALEPLLRTKEPAHNPYSYPPWPDFASQRLAKYIGRSFTDRGILAQTVFFSDTPKTRRNLNRVVSASIRPQGEYDKWSFAEGLVTGKIVAISARLR